MKNFIKNFMQKTESMYFSIMDFFIELFFILWQWEEGCKQGNQNSILKKLEIQS